MNKEIKTYKLKSYKLTKQALIDLASEFFGKISIVAPKESGAISFDFVDVEVPEQGTIDAKICASQFEDALFNFLKKSE